MNNNHITKNFDYRVFSFYREALELQSGTLCHPRFAIVYPTYICNQNCIGCDYKEFNNATESSMLTGSQFHHIFKEIVNFGIRGVEFCGGGEPLLHPELDNAIRFLHSSGVSIGLLTNGTNIDDSRADLLTTACSYIRISLEAGTEEVFARVKRPILPSAGFHHVIENTRRLLHFRKQNFVHCDIALKFTIDQNNMDDIENAVILANELGVDSIQFKCIRNVHSEIAYEQKVTLDDSLQRLRARYTGVSVIGSLIPIRIKVPCWLSPLHLMVDPLANLHLCCYYRHRFDRHRYGNLFEKSLRDLWYSAAHTDALNSIEKCDCEKYDCRFNRYAELMEHAIKSGRLNFL